MTGRPTPSYGSVLSDFHSKEPVFVQMVNKSFRDDLLCGKCKNLESSWFDGLCETVRQGINSH
jgi:hypothetical protein